jgi:hypothetical protein
MATLSDLVEAIGRHRSRERNRTRDRIEETRIGYPTLSARQTASAQKKMVRARLRVSPRVNSPGT